MTKTTKTTIVVVLVILLISFTLWLASISVEAPEEGPEVTSFQECVEAGNPTMESYPPQCSADGRNFTEPSCQTGTGTDVALLTISDAREIAKESECGDRLEDTYNCNENSGTWWIDMTLQKEGCNPACMVDVKTREAEINWRCTGFNPPASQSPEEEYKITAENWIKENAPTYKWDGQDLQFVESRGLDLVGCEDCYEYEFTFTSTHGGYGNRDSQMVTQALTNHTIVVTVEEGEVAKAVTDGKFDEMTGEMVEGSE